MQFFIMFYQFWIKCRHIIQGKFNHTCYQLKQQAHLRNMTPRLCFYHQYYVNYDQFSWGKCLKSELRPWLCTRGCTMQGGGVGGVLKLFERSRARKWLDWLIYNDELLNSSRVTITHKIVHCSLIIRLLQLIWVQMYFTKTCFRSYSQEGTWQNYKSNIKGYTFICNTDTWRIAQVLALQKCHFFKLLKMKVSHQQ